MKNTIFLFVMAVCFYSVKSQVPKLDTYGINSGYDSFMIFSGQLDPSATLPDTIWFSVNHQITLDSVKYLGDTMFIQTSFDVADTINVLPFGNLTPGNNYTVGVDLENSNGIKYYTCTGWTSYPAGILDLSASVSKIWLPAGSKTIRYRGMLENSTMKVTDMLGRTAAEFQTGDGSGQSDVSNLMPGTYFAEALSAEGEKPTVRKIIIDY